MNTAGNMVKNDLYFDTLKVKPKMSINEIQQRAKEKCINLRYYDNETVIFRFL